MEQRILASVSSFPKGVYQHSSTERSTVWVQACAWSPCKNNYHGEKLSRVWWILKYFDCVAIHIPGACCTKSLPTGICWAGAISSFRYSGKLLSLERLSGTTNLGWIRAGDLVIWGSISHSFESFNPLPVSSHNNLSFLWIFCQWELEGSRVITIRFFRYSGISARCIAFFFVILKRGCLQKQEI